MGFRLLLISPKSLAGFSWIDERRILIPASFEALNPEAFEDLRTNEVKVNYWVVCPRKVWLYTKGFRREPLSERVALGRLLHERAYPDLPRREF